MGLTPTGTAEALSTEHMRFPGEAASPLLRGLSLALETHPVHLIASLP